MILLLCVALSIGLWLRLRQLNAYKAAPAGGTGTVEGTEINITARLAARITAVHVREGDTVQQGQPLVELDCAEPRAVLAEAQARLAVAEANVQSARINYTANRLDFLRLIEAQRQLRMQQEKYYQAISEYHRRLAELERAIGGPLP